MPCDVCGTLSGDGVPFLWSRVVSGVFRQRAVSVRTLLTVPRTLTVPDTFFREENIHRNREERTKQQQLTHQLLRTTLNCPTAYLLSNRPSVVPIWPALAVGVLSPSLRRVRCGSMHFYSRAGWRGRVVDDTAAKERALKRALLPAWSRTSSLKEFNKLVKAMAEERKEAREFREAHTRSPHHRWRLAHDCRRWVGCGTVVARSAVVRLRVELRLQLLIQIRSSLQPRAKRVGEETVVRRTCCVCGCCLNQMSSPSQVVVMVVGWLCWPALTPVAICAR